MRIPATTVERARRARRHRARGTVGAWVLGAVLVLAAGCGNVVFEDSTDASVSDDPGAADGEGSGGETSTGDASSGDAADGNGSDGSGGDSSDPGSDPADEAPAGTDPPVAVDPGLGEAEAQAAFDAYQQALLDRDGAAAVALVNPSTVAWYDEILVETITADAGVLTDELPLSTALSVVALRAQLGDEVLSITDGRQLFEVGVERGLVGDVGATSLDGISVEGDEAFGLIGGLPVLRFEPGGDGWLLDLAYTARVALDSSDAVIPSLSGGAATTRVELYELLAVGYGTTWAELAQPLG